MEISQILGYSCHEYAICKCASVFSLNLSNGFSINFKFWCIAICGWKTLLLFLRQNTRLFKIVRCLIRLKNFSLGYSQEIIFTFIKTTKQTTSLLSDMITIMIIVIVDTLNEIYKCAYLYYFISESKFKYKRT